VCDDPRGPRQPRKLLIHPAPHASLTPCTQITDQNRSFFLNQLDGFNSTLPPAERLRVC
jgi:hypothetical protein